MNIFDNLQNLIINKKKELKRRKRILKIKKQYNNILKDFDLNNIKNMIEYSKKIKNIYKNI